MEFKQAKMARIHPSAIVDDTAQLGQDVIVGPNTLIDSRTCVGDGTVIGANVVIGKDVTIGTNNQLFANCVIGGRPQILGSDHNTPVGGLIIGHENTIREQVTIHPSMYPGEFTRIGNENLLMIGVHIGHDCILEDRIVMSNYVQISGHCKIGEGVWFSGMVLLHQFVTIGRWCYAAGLAGINHDIPPFLTVSGHYPPAVRGINKRGLVRAGMDDQQQKNIFNAYKKLYRNSGALLENAKTLAAEDGLDENVKEMLDVVFNSAEQRFGRYLENFRH